MKWNHGTMEDQVGNDMYSQSSTRNTDALHTLYDAIRRGGSNGLVDWGIHSVGVGEPMSALQQCGLKSHFAPEPGLLPGPVDA